MSTAKFESAQALFCAIADSVGSKNIDQVLKEFSNKNKFNIIDYRYFVLGS